MKERERWQGIEDGEQWVLLRYRTKLFSPPSSMMCERGQRKAKKRLPLALGNPLLTRASEEGEERETKQKAKTPKEKRP